MFRILCAIAALMIAALPAAAQDFETRATAAWIYDQTTGTVLLSKNADEPLPPASMSKLMTIYMAFEAIAPLLWMRAGGRGKLITTATDAYALADTYGVLFAIDAAGAFADAVDQADDVQVVFIVTDDEKQFQRVSALLPARVETVRLYESYLRTFEINTGKE